MNAVFICYANAVVHADPRDLDEAVEIIRRAAQLDSIEKLEIALHMAKGQLRRELAGEGHISLTRIVATLAKEDKGFWRRYALELGCHYGLAHEAKRAAWFTFGVLGKKRMARIAARVPQKRSA